MLIDIWQLHPLDLMVCFWCWLLHSMSLCTGYTVCKMLKPQSFRGLCPQCLLPGLFPWSTGGLTSPLPPRRLVVHPPFRKPGYGPAARIVFMILWQFVSVIRRSTLVRNHMTLNGPSVEDVHFLSLHYTFYNVRIMSVYSHLTFRKWCIFFQYED